MTKRQYWADAQTPEANSPILIDFGRGSLRSSLLNQDEDRYISNSDYEDVASHLELHTIADDIQAYGALIWELTLRWMKLTNRKMIPEPLVKVIADCLSPDPDDRPSMIDVVKSFETLDGSSQGKDGKEKSASEISRKDAQAYLNPLLTSSVDRPKPSVPSYRPTISFSYRTIGWSYESDDEEG